MPAARNSRRHPAGATAAGHASRHARAARLARTRRPLAASLLLLLLLLAVAPAGCVQQPVGRLLVGRWSGEPDTAAMRRERTPREGPATAAIPADDSVPTLLESYDFQIELELAESGKMRMRVLGGGEQVEGSWRVVSQRVGQGIVEMTRPLPEGAGAPAAPNGRPESVPGGLAVSEVRVAAGEQRRFEVRVTPGGDAFSLREVGADPRFGQLYFQRVRPPRGSGQPGG